MFKYESQDLCIDLILPQPCWLGWWVMMTMNTEPDLPDNWGREEAACADGQHRYLPDDPRCGCGARTNPQVEHARLEHDVIKVARTMVSESASNWDKLVSFRRLAAAVIALDKFETGKS